MRSASATHDSCGVPVSQEPPDTPADHTECGAHPQHALLPYPQWGHVHHHHSCCAVRVPQDGRVPSDHLFSEEGLLRVCDSLTRVYSGELGGHFEDVRSSHRVRTAE